MVGDLSERVPAAQDYEIVVGLARIVAALGPRDGHSRLKLFSPALHFHLLPLNSYTYSDGLFGRAAAKEYGSDRFGVVVASGVLRFQYGIIVGPVPLTIQNTGFVMMAVGGT